jgi:hypothetical protein
MFDIDGGTVANENAAAEFVPTTRDHRPTATIAIHVLVALTALAFAYAVAETSVHSIAIVTAAIVYVSWFGGRTVGMLVAAGVGAHELVLRPELLSVVSASGALLLAWGVTTLEEVTRPSAADSGPGEP